MKIWILSASILLLAACGGQPGEDGEDPGGTVSVDSILPIGPSNNGNPKVSGTAPAGAMVKFFGDSSCSGTILATGTADANGKFSFDVPMPANTASRIYANASLNGKTSSCSTTSVAYTHDSIPPALPVVTVPASSPYNQTSGVSSFAIQGRCSPDTDHLTGPAGAVIPVSNGAWSYVANLVINASSSFTFHSWDKAGNQSAGVTQVISWNPAGVEVILAGAMPGGLQTSGGVELHSGLDVFPAKKTDASAGFHLWSTLLDLLSML